MKIIQKIIQKCTEILLTNNHLPSIDKSNVKEHHFNHVLFIKNAQPSNMTSDRMGDSKMDR